MLIIPHKFPKANWYVCVCACMRASTKQVCIYWQVVRSKSTLSVFTYENVPDWKVNSFFPMRFGIQNNIKADFSFTSFDPSDFPTDTSQLKGMTSLFIKSTLMLCSCLFRRGKSKVEITSSRVVCLRWKNANEYLFTSECMARCFLHTRSCRLTTPSSPGGNLAQHIILFYFSFSCTSWFTLLTLYTHCVPVMCLTGFCLSHPDVTFQINVHLFWIQFMCLWFSVCVGIA